MNFIKYPIYVLFFSVLLSGCKKGSDQVDSGLPQSRQSILMDSLQKLDSLVLSKRTKNVTEAVRFAKLSGKIAMTLNSPVAFTKSYIMLGNAYSVFMMDSGFYFYNKALMLIDSADLQEYRGKVLYNLGMLHRAAGNYKTSIILLDSALSSSRLSSDSTTESNSFNSLGNVYYSIGDEVNARKMFNLALDIAKSKSLYLQMGASLGNLAKFETDPVKAIELNKNAIFYLRKCNGSGEPIAQILINIANCFSDPDSSMHYYKLALNLVSVENSPEVIIGIYNNMAYSYLEKGDLINAEKCIVDFALPVAIKTNNIDWQSTVYDTYADILHQKGKLADAIVCEKKAIEAMQTASKLAAAKQMQLLAAMLELKNKELIIKDTKIENEQIRSRLRFRNQMIIMILLLLASMAGIFLGWVQKKRIQIQRQQIASATKLIEAEENEKAKIGRDIHDLTGQKFTGLKGFLENSDFHDPEKKSEALGMLQEIKDVVREISHRMNRSWLERFTLEKSIIGLCEDVKKMTGVNLEYHSPLEYPLVSENIKIHVFRIIQELLSNAVKHASRSKVILDITFDAGNLLLKYKDDGPGFSKDKLKNNGIGLSNLFERVTLLNGRIELDSHPGYGVYYGISIPLAQENSVIPKFSVQS